MTRKSYQKRLHLLLLIFALFLMTGPIFMRVNAAPKDELDEVWERAQQSGAYHFDADILQMNTPQATVMNAGRELTQHRLYMEGDTDIRAETLHLMFWSNGGSADLPTSGVELQVEGDTAFARQGNGAWKEVDDFTSLFAPGGNFLAYTQAAENVVRHAPETRPTAAGNVEVTRYTFDINGRKFAIQMRAQMQEQAIREGLPATMQLELPKVYAEMVGQGELWVGADGLPLRQTFALRFPEDADNYVATAEVTVDFSDFAPLPYATMPGQIGQRVRLGFESVATPRNTFGLAVVALGLVFVSLVVTRRLSRTFYACLVAIIIASMLATPLLSARRVAAFSAHQDQKQAIRDQQAAARERQSSIRDELQAAAKSPHTDPMTAAQASVAPQAAGSNEYHDTSCASDPTGDIDGDGLNNLSECLVGTLLDVADTDADGITDTLEVEGFSYLGQTWYTDPLNNDSNYDGIADGKEWHLDTDGSSGTSDPGDTDGDGTPDLWDDDNDGDGVRDSQDLSPYATTMSADPFTGDDPFALTINDLTADELVRVEFQLRPTNPDNLWYSQSVLDWPEDQQGQIQDYDGATFYDLDTSLDPWPNANGDMRLTPMLEITMPIDDANLPPSATCTNSDGSTVTCYPLLQQFGIAVQQVDDNTLAAYVPVQLVNDETGDANIAFYARMFYQATGSWDTAHEVRLVWTVQMLNDICGYPDQAPDGYPDNAVWPPDPDMKPSGWSGDWPGEYSLFQDGLCQFYAATNQTQVVQTYDDEWYFTGLHMMEEHSADIALIYEDPSVTGAVSSGYDSPFYMDTLYGLLFGLDSSFLAGRTCADEDSCTGDEALDMTVDTIGDRFNHATNSYNAADPTYWGLPNVLSVVKNGVARTAGDGLGSYSAIASYNAIDIGMMDTTVTQTVKILDGVFTATWSENAPITPTIMVASQQIYRDLNLDQTIGDDPNISWDGSSLTLDLPQSGANQVEVNMMNSVKWTPYAYDPATGWAAADINEFYNTLSVQLGSAFSDITDPDEAVTQQTMAQALYMAVYSGDTDLVQMGDIVITQSYQKPDEPIYLSLGATLTSYIARTVYIYFNYDAELKLIAKSFPDPTSVSQGTLVRAYLQQRIFDKANTASGIAGLTFSAILLVLFITDIIVNYILHDENTPGGEAISDATQIGFNLYSAYRVYRAVRKAVQVAQYVAEADETVTLAEAYANTLTSASTLVRSTEIMSAIGFVISVGIAIGMFAYAWASGAVSPGTTAFNELIAQTIAAIIVALILLVLSLSVIGYILVSILTIIDSILTVAGSKFTITGWFTKTIASVVYQFDLDTDQNVESGQFTTALGNRDVGMIAGNTMTQTLPLTTTLTQHWFDTVDRLRSNSLIYALSPQIESLSTSTGARTNDWTVSLSNDAIMNPLYKAVAEDITQAEVTLSAGINSSVPLYLNSAYALRGESCWVGFCSDKTVAGNSSDDLGSLIILDVLPATLGEFTAVAGWGDVGFLDADGDGMLPYSAGGLDPDDSTWDIDGDWLPDSYEITIRSRAVSAGGVNLDYSKADTDEDGINDYAELRIGTNPGSNDSDGDSLRDIEEATLTVTGGKLVYNGGSGWLIPYAYDASTQTTSETIVWSSPNSVDADGDGMSDLFEQSQTTLTTDPWADPIDPQVYNPNVWNQSPVSLYPDDASTDGFVLPGASILYTTTTQNNLGSGQELVGELSLALPSGVSGSPLSQIVDIDNGESGELVTTLNFPSAGSAPYEFASSMSLTDFDETRWSWDEPVASSLTTENGDAYGVAIAAPTGWDLPYVLVTNERSPVGATINAYLVDYDGNRGGAQNLFDAPVATAELTAPDVACNSDGVCLVAFGEISDGSETMSVIRLDQTIFNPSTLLVKDDVVFAAPSVATDGTDFMVAWGKFANAGQTEIAYEVIAVEGVGTTGDVQTLATLPATDGSVAIAGNGSSYTAVWTDDSNLYRANVETDGTVGSASVIGAGGGWPQIDGTELAPVLAYDAISDQMLLAYRDASGDLAARIMTADQTGDVFIMAESGVDGTGVVVALEPDAKNSGWILGWAASGGATVEFRALSPTGEARGDLSQVDPDALNAVALSCVIPRLLLDLELNESSGATVFTDSSPNSLTVGCGGDDEDQCPEAGFTGPNGNATTFNGSDNALVIPDGINLASRSFSLSAWARRASSGSTDLILSQGTSDTNQGLQFGFYDNDIFVCTFSNNDLNTKSKYTDTDWHHWVCTYDAATDTRIIYRDGVPVATQHFNETGNYIGSGPLYVGRYAPNKSGYFDGLLQDVAIYDHALSPNEIQDIFEQPIGVYDLDEHQNSKAFVNSADTGFNGACSGDTCPTLGVPGVSYTAALFDGTNDYIEIPALPEVDTTYQWTFENSDLSGWSNDNGPITTRAQAIRNSASTHYLAGDSFDLDVSLPWLEIKNLPAHDSASVSYDLYVIGSDWTGAGMNGFQSQFLNYTNSETLFKTTFSNEAGNTIGAYQLYPAQSWQNYYATLFENGNCQGNPQANYTGNGFDSELATDTTGGFTFHVNCVDTSDQTVANFYTGTNFGGTVYKRDPNRSTYQTPNNTQIKSLQVGPAAYYPKHGSTGDSLVVNGNSDNSVYQLGSTFDHDGTDLYLYFFGTFAFGLDNVKVELVKEANSFAFRDSSFTLSAWAKRSGADGEEYILSQGSDSTGDGLDFGFTEDNLFTCAFAGNALNTTATYTDTEWHQWVCTYDASTKTRTIYLDGEQVAQDTASANYSGFGATYIGKRFDNQAYFAGEIDEVGIWSQALAADEVQELHLKVKVEDESVLVCQLPVATETSGLELNLITLRETTTRIGDVSQTMTRTITVDDDAPTATIQTLSNGQYVSGANLVSIGGTSTDPTSYIAQNLVQMDSEAWQTATGQGTWTYLWDSSGQEEGHHTATVQATDAVGNMSDFATADFILDSTAPTISTDPVTVRPTQDTSGRWYVPLNGTVSDPSAGSVAGAGVAYVEVLLQGQEGGTGNGWQQAAVFDELWLVDYFLPSFSNSRAINIDPSGVYTVTLRATDRVSNTTSADDYFTTLITLDVLGPALTLTDPISTTDVISTLYTLEGSVEDLAEVSSVEVNLAPAAQIDALNSNVLHLPMDEKHQSEYYDDESGAGNDVSCTNTTCPTVGAQGQRDGAFNFDGSNDALNAGTSVVSLAKADFTIAAWVKTTGTHIALATKSNGDSAWDAGEKSFYLDSSGVPTFVGFGNNYIHGTTAVNDDQWHHVVVIWEYSGSGTVGTGKIYVDGLDDTASTTNYTDHNADNAGDAFQIGLPNYGNESPNYFSGLMDEFIVYPHALADYEVANLYAYGQGSWEPADLNGNAWSYTIPDGTDGIEGFYQINVRGTDALSITTPLSGQRLWRGEIDTKPPTIDFIVTSDTSGATETTTYECIATDFNLRQESDFNGYQKANASCAPGIEGVPAYRDSDLTLTTYAEVDAWYAATITDTSRLYQVDGVTTYAASPVEDATLSACDLYGHCTTVGPSASVAAPMDSAGAQVLSPSSVTVLTNTNPVSITGDSYARNGMQALTVLVNGVNVHTRRWEEANVFSHLWSLRWTPPGEGIYQFEMQIDDWAGGSGAATSQAPDRVAPPDAVPTQQEPAEGDQTGVRMYLPMIDLYASLSDSGNETLTYLPVVTAFNAAASGTYTGTRATLIVDLSPPEVSIASIVLTDTHRLGRRIVNLTGNADDSVWLHRVDVRIGDGAWQRAGIDGQGNWQYSWRLGLFDNGKSFEVSVRATDLAGHTTTVTETVQVDLGIFR